MTNTRLHDDVSLPRVYLVGGYMAPRVVLEPLRRRLSSMGYPAAIFRYATHRNEVGSHGDALAQRLASEGDGPVVLIGHSLGGLVVHEAINRGGVNLRHAVFVATPHRGCRVGRLARRLRWPTVLLGAGKGVSRGVEPAPLSAPTGVLIGTKDRVVSIAEARLAGATELQLPYGHNGLMIRPRGVNAIIRFIEYGAFEAPFDGARVVRMGLDQG